MRIGVEKSPHGRDITVYYKSKLTLLDPDKTPPTNIEDVAYDFCLGGQRVAQPGDARELAAFVVWPTFHYWLRTMGNPANTQKLAEVQVEGLLMRDKQIASAFLTVTRKDSAGTRETTHVHLEQARISFVLRVSPTLSDTRPSDTVLLVRSDTTEPNGDGKTWDLPSLPLGYEDPSTMSAQILASVIQRCVPQVYFAAPPAFMNTKLEAHHGIPAASLRGLYVHASVSLAPSASFDACRFVPVDEAWRHVHSPASLEALLLYPHCW